MLQPATSSADVGRRDYCHDENDEEEDDDEVEKVKWESSDTFDALTVWNHHALPDEKQDYWIRAVQEWIVMANAVRLWIPKV